MKKKNSKIISLRTCISCRTKKNQRDFLRVIRNKNGSVCIDINGKMHGRGAYLCKTKECIDNAEKTKAFNRTYKTDIGTEIYKEIRDYIENE